MVTMTIVMRDPNSTEQITTTLTYLNPELFPETGEIPQTSYSAADTVGRRISALSNNVYVDTLINRTESVTEILNS